jgi:membrane protease YdiL (CAAX protease family)
METPAAVAPSRRQLGIEIVVVLGVSFGISGLFSALDLLRSVTVTQAPLSKQVASAIYTPAAPQAWLDALYQSAGVLAALAPVALVAYLLIRTRESLATLGVDRSQPSSDVRWGVGLALGVGAVGLGFRLLANAMGINVQLSVGASGHWWQLVILVANSATTAIGEEIIVLAFVIHRLRQMGWSANRAVIISALVRGSYHLYQGLGGGVANMAMGLLLGHLFVRRGRAMPYVIAHFLIDAVATIGYVELHSRFHWLH